MIGIIETFFNGCLLDAIKCNIKGIEYGKEDIKDMESVKRAVFESCLHSFRDLQEITRITGIDWSDSQVVKLVEEEMNRAIRASSYMGSHSERTVEEELRQ